jgi:uncharacterized iron-regulated protein
MIMRGSRGLVLGLAAVLGMGALFVESLAAEEITIAVSDVRPTKENNCLGKFTFTTTKDG